jgi:allantoinase
MGDRKAQSVGSGILPDRENHGGEGSIALPGAMDAQVHSRRQLGQAAGAVAKRF